MLKLELLSSNWAIPLTFSQFDILEIKSDNEYKSPRDNFHTRIRKEFNVEKIEFNGYFGSFIYFTSTAINARRFKKYLNKYLVEPESYKMGFKDGESGADGREEIYSLEIQKKYYNSGWENGRNGRK